MEQKQVNNMKRFRIAGILVLLVAVALIVVDLVYPKFANNDAYRTNKVQSAQGQVDVVRGGKNIAAYGDMRLKNNDKVEVYQESMAVLRVDFDKYIFVDSDSELQLEVSEKDDSLTKINVVKGSIVSEVQQKLHTGQSFEVITPNSSMSIRGTTFKASVEKKDDGTYKVTFAVKEGEVAVKVIEKADNGQICVSEVAITANKQLAIDFPEKDVIEGKKIQEVLEKVSQKEIEVARVEKAEDYVSFSGTIKVTEEEYEADDFETAREEMEKLDDYVPKVIVAPTNTSTPTPTNTSTPTPTNTLTPTPTNTLTPIPTNTLTPTPTNTLTPTPTNTLTPIPTNTLTPTPTNTLTPTPTNTLTPIPTNTLTPTPTNTLTPTPTNTLTPTPTNTLTPTPTNMLTPIPTNTLTPVPTKTLTPTPTNTLTPTPTNTLTPTPTNTLTPVPTKTLTPTPTKKPTSTPTTTPVVQAGGNTEVAPHAHRYGDWVGQNPITMVNGNPVPGAQARSCMVQGCNHKEERYIYLPTYVEGSEEISDPENYTAALASIKVTSPLDENEEIKVTVNTATLFVRLLLFNENTFYYDYSEETNTFVSAKKASNVGFKLVVDMKSLVAHISVYDNRCGELIYYDELDFDFLFSPD